MSMIQDILAHKRTEISQFRAKFPPTYRVHKTGDLSPRAASLLAQLKGPQTALICEVKPASPSGGILQESPDIQGILKAYSKHAIAISVLTDTPYFGGSFELLKECSGLTEKPLLCKDFILDEIQLDYAQMCGASAVLLIVKALTDDRLKTLYGQAVERGLLPFVEVNDEAETHRALTINPQVILINNRNLDTLEMDMTTTSRLVPHIPKSITIISASGFSAAEDIRQIRPYASNFLIGSALMKTPPDQLDAKLHALTAFLPNPNER
jgi:indole-3-glycerol phosphate synthase